MPNWLDNYKRRYLYLDTLNQNLQKELSGEHLQCLAAQQAFESSGRRPMPAQASTQQFRMNERVKKRLWQQLNLQTCHNGGREHRPSPCKFIKPTQHVHEVLDAQLHVDS